MFDIDSYSFKVENNNTTHMKKEKKDEEETTAVTGHINNFVSDNIEED